MRYTAAGRWLAWGVVTFGVVLLATPASAQGNDAQLRMPRWDATGSVALHNVRSGDAHSDSDGLYDYWETNWEPGFQVGRYLTTHLKVEVGVRGPMQYHFYESDRIPLPGVPGRFGPASIDRRVTVISIAPAVTWQFLDNTFVHPYVSGGLDIDLADIHRFRDARSGSITISGATIRYDQPAVDSHEAIVDARPFIAIGTKSYFHSGRWFVRPEIQAGISKSRFAQVSLRLGVGADF